MVLLNILQSTDKHMHMKNLPKTEERTLLKRLDLSLAFCSVPLIYISVFVPVPYCLVDCGFVVEPEVRQVDSSSSILLLIMGENNSKWSNWKTTDLKNIQAAPAAQFQKNKWPNQKMGQRTKQTFSPKKTYRWLTNTWKDAQHHTLSVICKSKPQWSTILHWSEWLPSKSLQTINAGEGVEKREPSYTVDGNAN